MAGASSPGGIQRICHSGDQSAMVQYLLVTFTFEVVSLIVRGLITIIQEKKIDTLPKGQADDVVMCCSNVSNFDDADCVDQGAHGSKVAALKFDECCGHNRSLTALHWSPV
jgi:hypothetical protein